ncbi:MAG: MmcB family DNA repair protein [Elioraea sp.]|nr:MmcB family DNA repair protein [Elioraea sp.]
METSTEAGSRFEERTAALTRGAARLFAALGQHVLHEVPLPNGRRVDLLALSPDDRLTIVEVKSGVADFRRDRKWAEYLSFCDGLVFAVPADFPLALIPDQVGVAVVDREGGALLRAPIPQPLAPARRKALIGRFARLAAARLEALRDPWHAALWRVE